MSNENLTNLSALPEEVTSNKKFLKISFALFAAYLIAGMLGSIYALKGLSPSYVASPDEGWLFSVFSYLLLSLSVLFLILNLKKVTAFVNSKDLYAKIAVILVLYILSIIISLPIFGLISGFFILGMLFTAGLHYIAILCFLFYLGNKVFRKPKT